MFFNTIPKCSLAQQLPSAMHKDNVSQFWMYLKTGEGPLNSPRHPAGHRGKGPGGSRLEDPTTAAGGHLLEKGD